MDADFEQALARTRHPVLVVDDERRYVDGNAAALRLLGITREELLRCRIDDFVPADGLDEVWRDFLDRGGLTGHQTLTPRGRGEIVVRFGAVAHVAPGRHLSILLDDGDGDAPSAPASLLTAREREVIALAARGYTTREIAERLIVSPTTVDSHVRSAMERLAARNRVHAVALALARGEVELASEE